MTQYKITFRDERGVREMELDDVQLEDGIYEFWRGRDVIERVPADQVEKVESIGP
jgi:exonuclease VII small subunit